MKAKAIVRLKFSSKESLQMVLKALEPEVKTPATTRSMTSLEKEGLFLVLMAEAKDTTALRATLNAYLRWIDSIIRALGVLQKLS